MDNKEKQRQANREYQERRRRKLGVISRNQSRTNTAIDFVHLASQIHNNKYDYSNVVYKNCTTKIEIVCPDHGEFWQTPDAHKRGQGCPTCGYMNRVKQRKRKTTEQFVQEAMKKHNAYYSYQDTKYTNIHSKVIITCLVHGNFEQSPKAHLQGQGCPSCANQRRATFYESVGECEVEAFLRENKFLYERQKTFDGCKFKMLLRYDFFLPKERILIEFDGQQHYVFTPRFHGTEEGFITFQNRDEIKTRFARDKGFKLIRIKWNENIPQVLANNLK